MLGIVVVSHSAPLARAAADLARSLAPPDRCPRIEVAAGDDRLGADAASIGAAIRAADAGDGVLVVLDLGSSVLATKLAVGFLDADLAARVTVSPGPMVEGLLAAVVAIAGGADAAAATETACHALDAKRSRLDTCDTCDGRGSCPHLGGSVTMPLLTIARTPRASPTASPTLTWRTTVDNVHGLHIRPCALIVTALRDVDADVEVANATTGRGPAPASSLARLAELEIGRGHILQARISGPEAERARDVLADLAAGHFGEGPGSPRVARTWASAPATVPPDEPLLPGAGTQIAIGPIHRRTAVPSVDGYHPRSPKEELLRFNHAVDEVTATLATLATQRPASADILEAQATLAGDRELAHDVVARITEGFSAADAVIDRLTRMARAMDGLTDPYLRERAQDVRSVRRLLLLALMGRPLAEDDPGEPCVWLVEELDAATALRMERRLCLGVITTAGGESGHGVLTAAARGIPVLAGRPDAAELAEGQGVAFDPVTKELWVEPAPDLIDVLHERTRSRIAAAAAAQARALEPAFTADGRRISVEVNVSSLADAHAGARAGAEGSGIVRTELIFAARTQAPTALEQAEVYRDIARVLRGPVTIRTWDAGGDKPLAFLPVPLEPNPALGQRGLRAMRDHEALFVEQLRGIALAAKQAPLRLMFPMVTQPEEVAWAREVLAGVLAEVGPVELPVGIMIEVPAAALRAADFAGLIDFVSIGTNDLAQYTLAADRTNAAVASLAELDSPAVWDLLGLACQGLVGIPIGVCGELAGEPWATQRLLGLGVTELSVSPPMVAQTKQAVRSASVLGRG